MRSYEDLRQVLLKNVIPLLQEYFYGAWDKVCIVLGCPYDREGKPERENTHPIISCDLWNEEDVLGFDHQDYLESHLVYEVTEEFRGAPGELKDDELKSYLEGIVHPQQSESAAAPSESN